MNGPLKPATVRPALQSALQALHTLQEAAERAACAATMIEAAAALSMLAEAAEFDRVDL